ncbi:GNAT family N-acetyltransferase [Halobacillus rhizosphaerae]|uniref:GNAT family N-acetyltransferase n=1 Tax=Halobacillus rhizosphaerae TaxID=3064889 RepID=UPI00398AADB4
MELQHKQFHNHEVEYWIRSAREEDAKRLSEIRLKIDGETENLDREQGEDYIDEKAFKQLIKEDAQRGNNLFLVSEVNGEIVGYSRCEGKVLKRSAHKAEFGLAILKAFWGLGIGGNLLRETVHWADEAGIKKVTLNVMETNDKAINLYKKFGFVIEGILKKDKQLSDGEFYNTVMMARFHGE